MKLNLNWTLSVRQTETDSAPRHAGPALFVCCLLKLFLLLLLMLLLLGTSSLYSCAYLVRFYLLYTVFPVFSFPLSHSLFPSYIRNEMRAQVLIVSQSFCVLRAFSSVNRFGTFDLPSLSLSLLSLFPYLFTLAHVSSCQ